MDDLDAGKGRQLPPRQSRQSGPELDADDVVATARKRQRCLAGLAADLEEARARGVDPELRIAKPVRLLRDGGHLAVAGSLHVQRPDGDTFWLDVQEDYDAAAPNEDNAPPPLPDAVESLRDEIEAGGLFEYADSRRYLWDQAYTADEYTALLSTYSGHRALDDDRRDDLYARIRRRIQSRPGGRVTKTYLTMLNVARKR